MGTSGGNSSSQGRFNLGVETYQVIVGAGGTTARNGVDSSVFNIVTTGGGSGAVMQNSDGVLEGGSAGGRHAASFVSNVFNPAIPGIPGQGSAGGAA